MTQEPKLLTEAEWREMFIGHLFDMHEPTLRERGLIAPEPVDPLLRLLAVQIKDYLLPSGDEIDVQWIVNRIAQHCVEMAQRPALTREMVREALLTSASTGERYYSNVHAVLTEMMKGDVE